MKIKMVKIDDSRCFGLPVEYDVKGVKIIEVSIDNNIIPKSRYAPIGERKVDINLVLPKETAVYAEIEQL